jgi:hypothetical protein
MPKTLPEITRDATELSANDRLKLARILLDISDFLSISPMQLKEI